MGVLFAPASATAPTGIAPAAAAAAAAAAEPSGHSLPYCPPTRRRHSVALIYFPFDEGTVRNGGRAGAARSCAVVQTMLLKMGAVVNAELGIDLRQHVLLVEGGTAVGATLEAG